MNPNESKLTQFVEDTVMFLAVKAILFSEFDLNTVIVGGETMSNEVLGQITHAKLGGRILLEAGFKELGKFKRPEQRDKPVDNPNHV